MIHRLILAGTGNIAGHHAEAVTAMRDRAQIVAAVDVDAERVAVFADTYEIPSRYTSYADALANEPDAEVVVLCTPPGLHKEQAIAALDSGRTVLCEKPPTLTLSDLDEIVAAEQRSGRYFATVFQQRYGGGSARLRELAADASFGRPTAAVCHTLWFRPPAYFALEWRGRWETEGGGPTMGHGIHQMDLMLSVLGPWSEVTAVAARRARETNTEDVSAAIVTFDSGVVASVVNSLLSPRESSYLRFDFEYATAELSHVYGYGSHDWTITGAPGHEDTAHKLWATQDRGGHTAPPTGHIPQYAAVLDALDAGAPPPVTSSDARATLELSAAIFASAFTGRPVRRGEIAEGSPFYMSMAGEGAPWAPVK